MRNALRAFAGALVVLCCMAGQLGAGTSQATVTAHLFGRVVDPQGNPLANFKLQAVGLTLASGSTTTDGSFDLGVHAGSWTLQPDPNDPSTQNFLGPATIFAVRDGVSISNIQYVVQSAVTQITGLLTDDQNKPISGIGISATLGNYAASITTDAFGKYVLNVFAGTWNVNVDGDALISKAFAPVESKPAVVVSDPLELDFSADPAPSAFDITISTLPDGKAGVPYNLTLPVSLGHASAYEWSMSEGTLPNGLTLFPNGTITGTPGGIGNYSFRVTAFNAAVGSSQQTISLFIRQTGTISRDVMAYGIAKVQAYTQTSVAPSSPQSGSSFSFLSFVQSTNISALSNLSVQLPNSTIQTLALHTNKFLFEDDFTNQTALDFGYPTGSYKINIGSLHDGAKTLPINLAAGTFPAVPHLKNFGALAAVNSHTNLVLAWDPFTGGTTNDWILLTIANGDGAQIYTSPIYRQPGALNGTHLTATIPSGTLTNETTYNASLWFAKTAFVNTTNYDGTPGVMIYVRRTDFSLRTIGILAPTVTLQPQGKSVVAGATVSFRTVAGGTDPFTFQWQMNGTPITGATNDTLTLVKVSPSDSGAYSVQITNPSGTVTSANAILSVSKESIRPTVTISSPAASTRTSNDVLTVTGKAADNVSVSNIQFRVGTGNFQSAIGTSSWSAQAALTPGLNTFQVKSIDTSGNESLVAQQSFTYVVMAPVILATNGSGTITPNLDGTSLEIGKSYTVTAKPLANYLFSSWNGPGIASINPTFTFVMQQDLEIDATFVRNPFPPLKGTYNGLFFETDAAQLASSGFFTLTLTDSGTYSGQLKFASEILAITGKFDLSGKSQISIVRSKRTPLTLNLALDISAESTQQISGTVSDGTWTAILLANLSVYNGTTLKAPHVGKYTMAFPGGDDDSQPPGTSFGTVSVDATGLIKMIGTLSDNTSISQNIAMSKLGQWPFYTGLYSGRGLILGWLVFDGEAGPAIHGSVFWAKGTNASDKYYPGGFIINKDAYGSNFSVPTDGRLLTVTNGLVTLTGGNLASSVSDTSVINAKTILVGGTEKVAFSLDATSGAIVGSFVHPISKTITSIRGVILQNQGTMRGFFMGTNMGGAFSLEPQP